MYLEYNLFKVRIYFIPHLYIWVLIKKKKKVTHSKCSEKVSETIEWLKELKKL